MTFDYNSSEYFVPCTPFYLAIFFCFWAIITKKKWVNSLILSICFSSLALVFLLIKKEIIGVGNAEIGFNIAMYASPFATLPLACFGWYLGRNLNFFKTVVISLCILILYFCLAFSYRGLVIKNATELTLNSEIDCLKFPYHCAVKNKQFDLIRNLKLSKHNIEAREAKTGLTALWLGINDEFAVKSLLENGADANSINGQNETPLAYVLAITMKPNFRIASLLLKHGGQINQKIGVHKKMTILNIQIINKNLEAIKFSLENGADPKNADDYGHNACARLKKMKLVDSFIFNKICNLP